MPHFIHFELVTSLDNPNQIVHKFKHVNDFSVKVQQSKYNSKKTNKKTNKVFSVQVSNLLLDQL